ncbi:uncharacterized protein MYCFIDRAFT_180252 [Pseudocercospora fijiensis CIRAD86]|uniref:Uncharacterized protein n=1 Tax=Pseudocercospora fijiensis (strain CIRAD86) TaxID=383855 RepID=M3AHW7_PSEFD|nr:uncharacterized protein MYCFIDRAFT_180252 [Pseudocercospora fijiensis CIRAD86]EME77107.1 hypothetical protein MYCFIDRAFT_180252 [Pseudocercospora fijiensis CIRAD86]
MELPRRFVRVGKEMGRHKEGELINYYVDVDISGAGYRWPLGGYFCILTQHRFGGMHISVSVLLYSTVKVYYARRRQVVVAYDFYAACVALKLILHRPCEYVSCLLSLPLRLTFSRCFLLFTVSSTPLRLLPRADSVLASWIGRSLRVCGLYGCRRESRWCGRFWEVLGEVMDETMAHSHLPHVKDSKSEEGNVTEIVEDVKPCQRGGRAGREDVMRDDDFADPTEEWFEYGHGLFSKHERVRRMSWEAEWTSTKRTGLASPTPTASYYSTTLLHLLHLLRHTQPAHAVPVAEAEAEADRFHVDFSQCRQHRHRRLNLVEEPAKNTVRQPSHYIGLRLISHRNGVVRAHTRQGNMHAAHATVTLPRDNSCEKQVMRAPKKYFMLEARRFPLNRYLRLLNLVGSKPRHTHLRPVPTTANLIATHSKKMAINSTAPPPTTTAPVRSTSAIPIPTRDILPIRQPTPTGPIKITSVASASSSITRTKCKMNNPASPKFWACIRHLGACVRMRVCGSGGGGSLGFVRCYVIRDDANGGGHDGCEARTNCFRPFALVSGYDGTLPGNLLTVRRDTSNDFTTLTTRHSDSLTTTGLCENFTNEIGNVRHFAFQFFSILGLPPSQPQPFSDAEASRSWGFSQREDMLWLRRTMSSNSLQSMICMHTVGQAAVRFSDAETLDCTIQLDALHRYAAAKSTSSRFVTHDECDNFRTHFHPPRFYQHRCALFLSTPPPYRERWAMGHTDLTSRTAAYYIFSILGEVDEVGRIYISTTHDQHFQPYRSQFITVQPPYQRRIHCPQRTPQQAHRPTQARASIRYCIMSKNFKIIGTEAARAGSQHPSLTAGNPNSSKEGRYDHFPLRTLFLGTIYHASLVAFEIHLRPCASIVWTLTTGCYLVYVLGISTCGMLSRLLGAPRRAFPEASHSRLSHLQHRHYHHHHLYFSHSTADTFAIAILSDTLDMIHLELCLPRNFVHLRNTFSFPAPSLPSRLTRACPLVQEYDIWKSWRSFPHPSHPAGAGQKDLLQLPARSPPGNLFQAQFAAGESSGRALLQNVCIEHALELPIAGSCLCATWRFARGGLHTSEDSVSVHGRSTLSGCASASTCKDKFPFFEVFFSCVAKQAPLPIQLNLRRLTGHDDGANKPSAQRTMHKQASRESLQRGTQDRSRSHCEAQEAPASVPNQENSIHGKYAELLQTSNCRALCLFPQSVSPKCQKDNHGLKAALFQRHVRDLDKSIAKRDSRGRLDIMKKMVLDCACGYHCEEGPGHNTRELDAMLYRNCIDLGLEVSCSMPTADDGASGISSESDGMTFGARSLSNETPFSGASQLGDEGLGTVYTYVIETWHIMPLHQVVVVIGCAWNAFYVTETCSHTTNHAYSTSHRQQELPRPMLVLLYLISEELCRSHPVLKRSAPTSDHFTVEKDSWWSRLDMDTDGNPVLSGNGSASLPPTTSFGPEAVKNSWPRLDTNANNALMPHCDQAVKNSWPQFDTNANSLPLPANGSTSPPLTTSFDANVRRAKNAPMAPHSDPAPKKSWPRLYTDGDLTLPSYGGASLSPSISLPDDGSTSLPPTTSFANTYAFMHSAQAVNEPFATTTTSTFHHHLRSPSLLLTTNPLLPPASVFNPAPILSQLTPSLRKPLLLLPTRWIWSRFTNNGNDNDDVGCLTSEEEESPEIDEGSSSLPLPLPDKVAVQHTFASLDHQACFNFAFSIYQPDSCLHDLRNEVTAGRLRFSRLSGLFPLRPFHPRFEIPPLLSEIWQAVSERGILAGFHSGNSTKHVFTCNVSDSLPGRSLSNNMAWVRPAGWKSRPNYIAYARTPWTENQDLTTWRVQGQLTANRGRFIYMACLDHEMAVEQLSINGFGMSTELRMIVKSSRDIPESRSQKVDASRNELLDLNFHIQAAAFGSRVWRGSDRVRSWLRVLLVSEPSDRSYGSDDPRGLALDGLQQVAIIPRSLDVLRLSCSMAGYDCGSSMTRTTLGRARNNASNVCLSTDCLALPTRHWTLVYRLLNSPLSHQPATQPVANVVGAFPELGIHNSEVWDVRPIMHDHDPRRTLSQMISRIVKMACSTLPLEMRNREDSGTKHTNESWMAEGAILDDRQNTPGPVVVVDVPYAGRRPCCNDRACAQNGSEDGSMLRMHEFPMATLKPRRNLAAMNTVDPCQCAITRTRRQRASEVLMISRGNGREQSYPCEHPTDGRLIILEPHMMVVITGPELGEQSPASSGATDGCLITPEPRIMVDLEFGEIVDEIPVRIGFVRSLVRAVACFKRRYGWLPQYPRATRPELGEIADDVPTRISFVNHPVRLWEGEIWELEEHGCLIILDPRIIIMIKGPELGEIAAGVPVRIAFVNHPVRLWEGEIWELEEHGCPIILKPRMMNDTIQPNLTSSTGLNQQENVGVQRKKALQMAEYVRWTCRSELEAAFTSLRRGVWHRSPQRKDDSTNCIAKVAIQTIWLSSSRLRLLASP